ASPPSGRATALGANGGRGPVSIYRHRIRPAPQTMLARRSAQAVPVAVHSTELQASPDELKAAILLFYGLLDEQQRRLFAGLESIRVGHGGDTLLGDFLGLDVHTVARGRQQLLDRDVIGGRARREGGGRTPTEKKRPT